MMAIQRRAGWCLQRGTAHPVTLPRASPTGSILEVVRPLRPLWNVSGAQISSDPLDGIGRWRTADLANALLSGVSPDGRHYYPVFPYGSYTHMKPQQHELE